MADINQLSSSDTVSGADQFVVWSSSNGSTRRVAGQAVKDFVQEGFVPDGGVLGMASVYAMRILTPRVVAVTTSYANVLNYESSVSSNTVGSFVPMINTGEFVATRDCAMVQFWVGLTGSWPTNRDLTVALLVGPDSAPYESAFRFVGAGRGVGNPLTADLSGIANNLLAPFGTIKAGDKVRVVIKNSVADNLNLDRLSVAMMTMDGQ